jgi:hypothetical protein
MQPLACVDETAALCAGTSKLEPVSNPSPASITSTETLSQAKKVRSFAKKVLGSTRVRTRHQAVAHHLQCM